MIKIDKICKYCGNKMEYIKIPYADGHGYMHICYCKYMKKEESFKEFLDRTTKKVWNWDSFLAGFITGLIILSLLILLF